jgi:hypothetical protein
MARRHSSQVALFAGLLALGFLFRLAIVRTDSWSSPDSNQYYRLCEELIRANRFAFAPPPAPLTHSRLPGYPLFLARVAVRDALPEKLHTQRATVANAFLDSLTALFVALLALEAGLGWGAAMVSLIFVFVFPLLFLFCAYALTESLATCLATAALWAALRIRRRRALVYAGLSGALCGAALLVRADMLSLLPALATALWISLMPGKRRIVALSVFAGGCMLLIAPWMIRNQVQFGAPHLTGTEWSDVTGRPLPSGVIRWQRGWAAGQPGDSTLNAYFYFRRPIPLQLISPRMYDSEAERQKVVSLIEQYNARGLDAEVDRGFSELAAARAREHFFRTYLGLPLRRLPALYFYNPPGGFPLRVSFLGLPRHRGYFDVANVLAYLLALVGALVLFRGGGERRRLLAILLLAIAGRTILYMYAVPHDVEQRKLIEVVPLILVLAATAATAMATASARAGKQLFAQRKAEQGQRSE